MRQNRGSGGGEIHDGKAVASSDGGQTCGWVVGDGVGVAIELQAGDDAWRKGIAQIDDADAIAGGDQGQAGSWVNWIRRQGQIKRLTLKRE